MLNFSQLSKDVRTFTQTVQIIQKIDNKLGKTIAFDRANYKLQEIKNKMHESMNQITKNIQNRKINPKLTPLAAIENTKRTKQESFLSEYLSRTHKRDERFNRYEQSNNIQRQPQIRKNKVVKCKSRQIFKHYGPTNEKCKHNRALTREIDEDEYKQGMYTLSSKYQEDQIDMNYIQEVMPKPVKNPIARRNLDSIFVTKNQNNYTIYDDLLPKQYMKDQNNIFLTNHNEPFMNLNFTQIQRKERTEIGTDNLKSKSNDGLLLDILNYKLIINDTLKSFKLENLYRWSNITPVIYGIETLLKRYNISSARIKSRQLIKLSVFCKKIPDKLLLKCLNNQEEIQSILNQEQKLRKRNPQNAVSFIQSYWRYHRYLKSA